MSDQIKRSETINFKEADGGGTGSRQWLLENLHKAGSHPICNNSKVTVHICGEEGFRDIAAEIAAAKESIDLCCWGFDPGMELERAAGAEHWPRGKTYGELLTEAGARGVKVRLLVWYDTVVRYGSNPKNIVGYTHDTDHVGVKHASLSGNKVPSPKQSVNDVNGLNTNKLATWDMLERQARADYCGRWIRAARANELKGIEIRMRSGDSSAIKRSLSKESRKPESMTLERAGLDYVGTHHQKHILIDFFIDDGKKAVGYVMGLNSVTDYWDTTSHKLEDPRREHELVKDRKKALEKQAAEADSWAPGRDKERAAATSKVERYRLAIKQENDPRKLMVLERQYAAALEEAEELAQVLAFATVMPYRDYSCRIDGGGALVSVYNNFAKAWERAGPHTTRTEIGTRPIPATCLAKGKQTNPLVQIVRTQPEEQDKSIRDLYFQATDQAALASGYMYLENQYFYWPEWTERLLSVRKKVIERWQAGAKASGSKGSRAMPLMHVFIVIPVPERSQMIPRTFETLAPLGQHAHLSGQLDMVELEYKRETTVTAARSGERRTKRAIPDVIATAKKLDKPTLLELEKSHGLKVCTAMLNACGLRGSRWNYREIYIHSKLLLIDDTFFTVGSANLNLRSMAVDSEINIGVVSPAQAKDLRKRIWNQLTAGFVTGGAGTLAEIKDAFNDWSEQMSNNNLLMKSSQKLDGFLLPLEDSRSSTLRLG